MMAHWVITQCILLNFCEFTEAEDSLPNSPD